MPPALLATVTRNRLVENLHSGWAVVCDVASRVVRQTPGAAEHGGFFRSAAKPFQAHPLLSACPDLPSEALALACASHSGSAEHLRWVGWLLDAAGLTSEALQCGPHPPGDGESREALIREHRCPMPLHNNCSGKHAGMLLACQRHGWEVSTYLELEHPLQQAILQTLRHYGGFTEAIPTGVDGCGAPVYYLPLAAMARLYAVLGSHPDFAPMVAAMIQHPELVGDAQRIDTALMRASQGRLLAKVGADGVLAVSRLGTGEGLILKVADGSNEARDKIIPGLLEALGWLDAEALQHPRLGAFQDLTRRNTQGRAVGEWIRMPWHCLEGP